MPELPPRKKGDKIPFYEIEDNQWDLVFAINLNGAFYCIREVAKEMMKVRSGMHRQYCFKCGKDRGGAESAVKGTLFRFERRVDLFDEINGA